MIGMAAVRARGVTLLDVHNVGAGGLLFRFHNTIARIATRFGRDVALRWTQALVTYQGHVDLVQLQSAIASGNLQVVESVVNAHAMQQLIQKTLRDPLLRAAQTAGAQSVAALSAHGISASFNAVHPNVILYAQTQSAALVTSIPNDVRETIRLVTALGASGRATVNEQARMLKEVVGLPRNQVLAPLRFGDELRAARASGELGTLTRRLSGADMVQIRAALDAGTMTDTFIQEMQATYAQRLISLRAETIARTESLAAAHYGVQESWRQAVQAGDLPAEVKQFWIVTPDDRLCPICVEIPGMNPDGVGLHEPFATPEGPVDAPPAPHPNCRCSIGLVLPAAPGETAPEETLPPEAPAPEVPVATAPLVGEEAAAALSAMHAAAGVDFTQVQQGALRHYQGSAYARINGYLRADRRIRQDAEAVAFAKARIVQIDSAFARAHPTTEAVVTWRGASLENPHVGAIFVDRGFVSTSVDRATALSFASDSPESSRVMIRTVVPAGTHALWMDAITGHNLGEGELLLNRSSRFRVLQVRTVRIGGTPYRIVETELLHPEGPVPPLLGRRP